jgi:hypothetical protein
MKFGLLYEMEMPAEMGASEYDIFWQAIEQTKLAEQVGFVVGYKRHNRIV